MSADNWDFCPNCNAKAVREDAESTRRLEEAYGKVPLDEYAALQVAPQSTPSLKETLREDYEVGIIPSSSGDAPKFYVVYLASCQVCDWRYAYKHEDELAVPA